MRFVPDQKLSKPTLILGEGVDECNFFTAVAAHLGRDDVQVDHFGGKRRIAEGLKAIVRRPGFRTHVTSVGVVRDADYLDDPTADPAAAAFDSVCHALIGAGLNVPPAPGVGGRGTPTVAVFIMPGEGRPGMLEDLCMSSVPAAEAGCADDYFACVARHSGRTPQRHTLAKARVRAWLATSTDPDIRLGVAALSGKVWDLSQPAFDAVRLFVESL